MSPSSLPFAPAMSHPLPLHWRFVARRQRLCYQTGGPARTGAGNLGASAVPRFVILEHDPPRRHWDFLLETGRGLASWRLREEPGPGGSVPAEPAAPHRRLYLDYEGPVSGGRGSVVRWD